MNFLQAWHLWEEGRWLELAAATVSKEVHAAEGRRYINIALMCVHADDRPTMSDVVAGLNSESVVSILPEPKHPAYFNLRVSRAEESATVDGCSLNDVTITQDPEGR